jgi:N-acetylglucosaminyldiphosphoundecaprenol N-acetyl-beta-D-mannosaminyltransferase
MENKILNIIKDGWKDGLWPMMLLWLTLWAGYNANFWRMILPDFPVGAFDLIHGLRAFFPIVAGISAIIFLLVKKRFLPKGFFATPLGLLLIYAVVGIISSFFSSDIFRTLYGSLMFGSVIVIFLPFLYNEKFLKNASFIINMNWAIAGVLTAMLIIFFLVQPGVIKSLNYDSLMWGGRPYETLAGTKAGADTFGMPGTRPTGLGRYAGIVAVIAFCNFLGSKKKKKLIWFLLFFIFLLALFFSKGRTEIIAFIVATFFAIWLKREFKIYMLVLLAFILLWASLIILPNSLYSHIRTTKPETSAISSDVSKIGLKIYNSQEVKNILTLSGRTNGVWADSLHIFWASPLIGQGFQANNSLMTAHNTFLHALVQTGLLGSIPFVLSFLLVFLILLRLFKDPDIWEKENYFLISAISAFAFFGVRSITESMAVYSADWLFVVPIIAYVQCLNYGSSVKNKGAIMDFNGTKINIIKMSEVLEKISFWIKQEKSKLHWIVATGMHGIVEAEGNFEFKQIISCADLFVPDGISLVWLAKLKGFDIQKRISGADLMAEFLKISEKEGFKNYFYGDTEDTLQGLREKYPKIKAEFYSPPFRELTEQEDKEIIEKINQACPDVLWVGLGLPKQERWIFKHKDRLNVPVVIGVGAAFKFLSGKINRAPKLVGDLGFEWLWRLVHEPRTVWKRVFLDMPIFFRLVAKENKFSRSFYIFFKNILLFIEKYLFWPFQKIFGEKLLEQLTPYDVIGFEEKIRLGNLYDGGYLIPRNVIPLIEVVYVYGVSNDIKFEEDLLKYKDVPIRLYDHTIDNLPRTNINMFFKKQGIAAKKHGNFDTFENHIKENQDNNKKILLKMDIEGDEWEIIDKIVANYSENIVAIILEAHRFYRYENIIKYIKKLSKINSKFTLIHIHGNNWSGFAESSVVKIKSKKIPNVCEITFINNILVKNKIIMSRDLPSIGDYPNAPQKEDICLNFWKK